MTIVDIQISAANTDWPELRDASLAAEAMGFGALFVFDHLAGVALGGRSMLDCFTWLGALAELTTTIELGSLVANAANREIGSLVTAAASVAIISQRHFHFGVGAGTSPNSHFAAEQRAVGAPIAATLGARHARVEAVLDLTDRLWHAPRSPDLATFPQPERAPTRIVGVNSLALSRIAGRRAEAVNVAWGHPRAVDFLDAATHAAAGAGRRVLRTAWIHYDSALLDPAHPTRQAMTTAALDRIVLSVMGRPELG